MGSEGLAANQHSSVHPLERGVKAFIEAIGRLTRLVYDLVLGADVACQCGIPQVDHRCSADPALYALLREIDGLIANSSARLAFRTRYRHYAFATLRGLCSLSGAESQGLLSSMMRAAT